MDVLPIVWQRLVDEHGLTCPRCRATGEEVERAVDALRNVLAPLGLEPTLERRPITADEFEASPIEGSRVLVDGRPIEFWVEPDEQPDLVLRAALAAAAHRLIQH